MNKILITDTLKTIIEEEKNILSRSDFQVLTATSAEEALKTHAREKVDLIIADLDIREMGGDWLCTAIRKDSTLEKVAIILVCLNNPADVERCKACGANAVITKPFHKEEIFRKAGQLLHAKERKGMRVLLQVSVEGKVKNEFFSTSHNISSSGILLETDKILRTGDQITCSFFIRQTQVTVQGIVARAESKGENLYHYGVKLLDLDPQTKALIEEFIDTRLGT